jgi:DNA topoisomerase VI subunit B
MGKTIQEQIAEMETRCSQSSKSFKSYLKKRSKMSSVSKQKRFTKSLKMAMKNQAILRRKLHHILA